MGVFRSAKALLFGKKEAEAMAASNEQEAWSLDQLTKSQFFHAKLHEWGMLEIAGEIEAVKGEELSWEWDRLGISERAWNKVIHRGIKPVVVFAHPKLLLEKPRAVAYYRMLAMVSQKSMHHTCLSVGRYERGNTFRNEDAARTIAEHLNKIICRLIEADEKIEPREFDLWRGMAAGSQAQGSWQNAKGKALEMTIKAMILARLRQKGVIQKESADGSRAKLDDGRTIVFASEPDIAIYLEDSIAVAVEIKSGLDPAGVLERIGASIKSLSRAKEADPIATTVLILRCVSVTDQAKQELEAHKAVVNRWFVAEDLLEDGPKRQELFRLLRI